MQTVSAAFLSALTQSHAWATSCTLTTPGGSSTTLQLDGDAPGSVSATSGQLIRRTADLRVIGGSDLWTKFSVPGALVTVSYGVDFGGGLTELVPLIKGELSSAATDYGDGTIGVNLADYGQRVQATPFLTAQSPATTAGRLATVIAAITGAISTTVDSSKATDTSTIGSSQTWTDRAGMISALLTDAGAEGFFLPDGSYRIRDLPQATDSPVWTIKTGEGGTIEKLSRSRPLDKLYNTVLVQPASLDASQTWTQQVAQISDTGNPRHPNYIGVRPYTWQSPTVMSTAEAQAVAGRILTRLQGSTDSLDLGALANPALDVGDVVRVTNPLDAGTGLVQHLIDSLRIDLRSGSMSLRTRSSQEAFA